MPRPIVMDCDPGIDDAAALVCAILEPQLDLKLVTTVAGNVSVEKTTQNALKIAEFVGSDVPVAAGAAQPLLKPFEDAARVHGESGLAGYDFPSPTRQPLTQTAVQALHSTIMTASEPLTLVATGAYTNIALLLREYPEVKSHIKQIVAMGGSLSGGNMTSVAEFNVFTDPDAAQIMYHAGIPIVTVGLDVTGKALVTPARVKSLAQTNRVGAMLAALINHYGDGSRKGRPMHDVNTICYLMHPEFYTTKDYWVDVQTSGPAIGALVADTRGAYHGDRTNAKVCLDIDAAAFNDWFLAEVQRAERHSE